MSQSQQERTAGGGPRTYSHWRRPTGGGLGPLTVAGTGLLLGGGVVTVVLAVFMKSLLAAGVAALLTAVALAATTVPVAGRPVVVRLAGWVAYRRSRSTRRYLYAAGVVAPVGTGRHQLPGIASGTRLWDCVDAYDQPFALIQATATHDFSVAVRCSSTGAELVDQVAVDRQVARWGEFLAQLGLEEHLVGCSVTVQTAPDPGVALTELLAAQRGQDPPALAVQVMTEIADTYPQASAVVDTVVQFTWSGIAEGRRRPVAEMAADIGASVPELLQLLVGTGAGTRPRAMGSAAVSAFVRRAYDPAQSTAIAALGDAGAGIDWDDAGPVSHTALRDSYTHDSGHTVVWSMSRPPRGVVHSDVLHDLLAPHDRIAVKRVTLLYRPFDPKLAADTVDHDVQAADFKTGQQNRVTARDRADSLAAAQAAEEEAAGAGLVAFGMLVSATVLDPADLPQARATVQNRLAGPARIALRPCYGYQPGADRAAPLLRLPARRVRRHAPDRDRPAPPHPAGPGQGQGRLMRLPTLLQSRLAKTGRPGLESTRPPRTSQPARTVPAPQRPPRPVHPVRPGPRGWAGAGGGADGWVEAPLEWRGTTRQVCGLWPHAAGSGVPNIGTVLGQHYFTATTVAADPINFLLHKVISNPGSFTLANAGVGKSFLTARLVVGAVFQGHVPFVMGDLKPDYVDLVARLGGQVATIGRGLGGLNVLNPGGLWQALHTAEHHLGDPEWTAAVADYLGWQQNGVAALLELSRGERLREHEETALAALLTVLRDRSDTVPVLPELLAALSERPELVRTVLGTRDDTEYDRLTAGLVMSLRSITTGAFGDTFAHNRQDAIDLEAPAVCLDISRINRMDRRMEGAALLNAWYAGSAAIFGAHLLADAGLAPHRTYYAVMDELWRSLRAGVGMARRIDEVTRRGRTDGQAFAMVTHSPNDLELSDPEDRKIARGFLSRADMKLLGALQDEEIDAMAGLVTLSRAERDLLTSWSSPEDWGGDGTEQPGLGKFLLKVGSRPGVPFRVRRTATEATWRDTSHRWNAATRAPHPDPDPDQR